jgi:hypothetical protein
MMPIGSGTRHQHILADQIEGKRGVDRIAQRIEDCRDFIRHIVGDRHYIVLRDRKVFGECAGTIYADAQRVAAQMAPARSAVSAMAADDMSLARYALADFVFSDGCAEIRDGSDKFMAGDHGNRHGLLRPLVPIVDMNVGAADRVFFDLDQHVVRADLGKRHLLHPDAGFGFRFDECAHHVGHQRIS